MNKSEDCRHSGAGLLPLAQSRAQRRGEPVMGRRRSTRYKMDSCHVPLPQPERQGTYGVLYPGIRARAPFRAVDAAYGVTAGASGSLGILDHFVSPVSSRAGHS